MKFSLNSLRHLNQKYKSADDIAAIGVDQLVEKIGAQLGAVDEVEYLGEKYKGIVVVKVVKCDKHADADKLSVCTIDDGGVVKDVARDKDGYVQVVCGAPNVHEGMTAAWLPPGATVPNTVGKDPFVLEARELRGVVSNGMLASPKELALGDSHAGLLELDSDLKAGADFAEIYGLKDDVIVAIENKMFTHRPDCFGFIGVARELAGIQGLAYTSPHWFTVKPTFPEPSADTLPLTVQNELPGVVPRFTAVAMSDIKVSPSPVWLQVELAKLGQKSINNIVDYTNYFMLLTGQPLHAFDYDKVKALSDGEGATIVVRNPHTDEKLKLLNGKEIDPRQDAIMIATNKQLIGVGGVMGGSETEVDDNTTNIIIECANFDMYSIRRTSMAHGLFTDAVTRFSKGQSPLQNLAVLAKIVDEISRSGGKVASPVIDDNHVEPSSIERASLRQPVKVSVDFINARLGFELNAPDIKKLLQNVEFTVETQGGDLVVSAPFWRTDIELREDIVEEVGRLYGYDHLPLLLPARDLTPATKDALFDLKAKIRARLSRAGANEILTYSFVHGDLLDKVGQDKAKAFEIANALSPDLQYYRPSLMPSLLEKIHGNIKAGYDEFALFEIGKTHTLDDLDADGLPREFEFTAVVFASADKLKKSGAPYYQARKYLDDLTGVELTLKPIPEDMDFAVLKPYDAKRSALVSIKGGEFLGIIGEFKPSVIRALKLPKYSAGFELDTTVLGKALTDGSKYKPLSRYPKVTQDITLKVSSDLRYQDLSEFLSQELKAEVDDQTDASLSAHDIYQKDGANNKNISFRLTVVNHTRTLTDAEVNNLLQKISSVAKTKFNAERV